MRDLELAQPVEVGQIDGEPQGRRQRIERRVDTAVVAAQVFQFVGRGDGSWLEVSAGRAQRPACASISAQAIDGTAARDGHHPAGGATPPRIEIPGALPQLDEGLLHDVLGTCPISKNTECDGHRASRVSVHQRADGPNLATGDTCEEMALFFLAMNVCFRLMPAPRHQSHALSTYATAAPTVARASSASHPPGWWRGDRSSTVTKSRRFRPSPRAGRARPQRLEDGRTLAM